VEEREDADSSTTATIDHFSRIDYQPALDGVRALAVISVLLFHGEVAGFGGGYLGVSVFFTLSGFLITSLLASETAETGTVQLGAFYARRARRLLPASLLLVLLVVLAAWTTDWFAGVADLRSHVVGSTLQVANWVFLAGEGSYQDLLQQTAGAASPLEHYWSLAIEEQFYWIWPLAFAALWRFGRTPLGRLLLLGFVTAAFAVAAPVTAAVWGSDATYWASPARAAEILIGAFVALAISGRRVSAQLWILAPLALGILAACVVLFPSSGGPAYAGWLPMIGVVSAALLLGLQVDSPVRTALGAPPLVWLGRISYGVYLFHWPLFVVLNSDRVGFDGPALLAVRLASTLLVAQASFMLFEMPIRRLSSVGFRPTIGWAAAATAVSITAALVVVPSTDSDYWVASDDVVAAAALDTDDAPLVVVTTPPSEGPTAPTVSSGPAVALPETTDATELTAPVSAETDSTEPDATTGSLAPPLPVLSRPVRIIVAGDSTGEALGAGLVSWAAANPELGQAELFAAAGCGFVRGGEFLAGEKWLPVATACAEWIDTRLPERVAQTGADVVVMVTSVWDVLDHRWDGGAGVATNTEEMRARLLFDYTRVTEQLLAGGAESVVWVKAPIPDPLWLPRIDVQEQPERHMALYEVMDQISASHPGDVYAVDLLGFFDESGYSTDQAVRPDGIHVDPDASAQIADEFLGEQVVRAALDLF
jgi:peptidoglycan/LPS O-acetylase OafA/YrhL